MKAKHLGKQHQVGVEVVAIQQTVIEPGRPHTLDGFWLHLGVDGAEAIADLLLYTMDQYSLTPTIVNAVHVTFNRLAINRAVSPDMPGTVGIGVNVYNAIPNYMSLSLSNRFSVGGGSNAPAFYSRNQYHYAEDLDVIRGRHHMSFGVEARTIQMNTRNISDANGTFSFNGQTTNDSMVDFFIGRPNTVHASQSGRGRPAAEISRCICARRYPRVEESQPAYRFAVGAISSGKGSERPRPPLLARRFHRRKKDRPVCECTAGIVLQ